MGALLRRIARTCILLMAAVILAIGLAGSWCAFAQSPKAPAAEKPAASGTPAAENLTRAAQAASPAINTKDIVNRLNQEFVKVLSQPDMKERFFKAGVEVVASTPDYMAVTMKSEAERLSKVIKAANIRVE